MQIIIDIAAGIVIYVFLFRKWLKRDRASVIVFSLMYFYLLAVIRVTLMPVITSLPFIWNHPYQWMYMVPFDDLMNNRGDTVRQIGLNVVMMMPFGFLLPISGTCKQKKYSFSFCVLMTLLLSFSIEMLQPLINGYRSSDITDVITNTTGGFLGYIIYLLFRPLINRILDKLRKENKNE